jgi:hypothetical protein
MLKFSPMVVNVKKSKEQFTHLNEISGVLFKIINYTQLTPVE